MVVAKVFRSGNSQAVPLPKQFRLEADEVEIFRRGDEVVLREKPRSLMKAIQAWRELPEEVFAFEDLADGPPQEREGL